MISAGRLGVVVTVRCERESRNVMAMGMVSITIVAMNVRQTAKCRRKAAPMPMEMPV